LLRLIARVGHRDLYVYHKDALALLSKQPETQPRLKAAEAEALQHWLAAEQKQKAQAERRRSATNCSISLSSFGFERSAQLRSCEISFGLLWIALRTHSIFPGCSLQETRFARLDADRIP
jgi:hypothetical protein